MSETPAATRARPVLSRRGALAAPLALTGCGLFSGDWFAEKKEAIPGKREPVLQSSDALAVDRSGSRVVLPPPVRNAAWPQAGGNPAHDMGQLAARPDLSLTWTASLGDGGGYRQKLLAQPVVAGGVVYTMDIRALVSAFDLATGRKLWDVPTRQKGDRGTNLGGGLGVADGVLYAVNGLGTVTALDVARGTERWRTAIGAPGRSPPTISTGRIFVITIEDRLIALDQGNGRRLWDYQAQNATTTLLGEPAPAFFAGIVVAGFGSGELTALRAEGGTVIWTDTLAAPTGAAGLADIASIRGNPAISGGRVFAGGMGGIVLALDLYSGRRLWQKSVAVEDSLWIAGDWVFLVTLDQVIAALRADSGRVAWAAPLPRYENPKNSSGPLTWFGPLLAGDRLVVAGTSGEALAVSPYTGEILGRQKLPAASAPVQPAIADGTLLLVAEDGRLMALR